ncbi:hypothetical protein SCA6_014512 [Theobroma cacao]
MPNAIRKKGNIIPLGIISYTFLLVPSSEFVERKIKIRERKEASQKKVALKMKRLDSKYKLIEAIEIVLIESHSPTVIWMQKRSSSCIHANSSAMQEQHSGWRGQKGDKTW